MARFKAHTGFGLKLIEQRATVFRNTHHALFIQVISRFVAIGQHLPQPAQLKQAAVGLENQRRMRPEKPFERFLRNARRRPRRGVAIRELAGIGKAGFHCRRFGAVDNRHLMAGFGQIPRGGHTRHACAQYDDVHVSSSLIYYLACVCISPCNHTFLLKIRLAAARQTNPSESGQSNQN